MAADPSQMPSFSRGSAVLEYWLVHAEGLVVQPLGARVEHVVVAVSAGRADTLIVRSRLMHRRQTIPAAAIAAVEPSTGRLLLDVAGDAARSARCAGQQPLPWWLCAGRGQLPRRCSPGCGPASWWPAPPSLPTRDSPRPGPCRASSGLRRASNAALLVLGGRQNAPPSWLRRT